MSKKLVKSLLASTVRELQSPNVKTGGKRNRRTRNKKRRSGISRIPRSGILAGYGSALSSSFSQNMIEDGLVVRGLDLLTSSFAPDEADDVYVSFYMNANPANWLGTRISAIATAFQNYRPIKFIIHYRPQVGSTDNRSVFIGTLWQGNMIYGSEAIEPGLLTSPGGTYLPSWQSCGTSVPLGNRLPMRMFPVRDPPSSVVPFSVFARSSNGGPSSVATEMPGRIFIEYEYEFRNALGPSSSDTYDEGGKVPSVRRCTFAHVRLYLGTSETQSDDTWVFWDEKSNSPAVDGIQGYLVAVNRGDYRPLPIGAQVGFDMIQARISPTGTPFVCCVVKINGEKVSTRLSGDNMVVYINANFGNPPSPVPPNPSSASFLEAHRIPRI